MVYMFGVMHARDFIIYGVFLMLNAVMQYLCSLLAVSYYYMLRVKSESAVCGEEKFSLPCRWYTRVRFPYNEWICNDLK